MTDEKEVRPLTKKQARVLRFIWRHWIKHGRSPTHRDIIDAMGFSGTNAVACFIRPLVKKGKLEPGDFGRAGMYPAGFRAEIRKAARRAMKEAKT